MSLRDRVRRTQYALGSITAAAALVWGASVATAALAVGAAAWLGLTLAAIATAVVLWFGRFAFSFERVVLWVEEHAPTLRYALVTAMDPRYAASLEPVTRELLPPTGIHVKRAAVRAILPPLLALAAAVSAVLLAPREVRSRVPRSADRPGAAAPLANRLSPMRAVVTPPAYSRLRAVTSMNPSTVSSLRGSAVRLSGREGWAHSFTMRDTAPSLLTLEDRGFKAQIVLDPKIDQAPNVTLRTPAQDTTLRVVAGNLELAADIADDIALARVRFEYIISSGDQENFTFREGNIAERTGGGAKSRLEASVSYESLKLKEGDRLSVRAVAWDNNTLYGPGKGVSETRTIRVARKGEYDPPSVRKAPPSADTALMSLRMLIIATEKLHARKDTTPRPAFVIESRKLALQADNVRRKIQQIIDETTGRGQVEADTLLTRAGEFMWEAARELNIAATGTALPPLYAAYKALEKLRNAKRYYLRGAQTPIIVNIERVRAEGGSDSGTATARMPRGAEASPRDDLRLAFSRAVRLLVQSPDSAMTVLMMMRVASLRTAPPRAAALGDVIVAMQQGRDVTLPLLNVRRLIDANTTKLDSLPAWSGAWPP